MRNKKKNTVMYINNETAELARDPKSFFARQAGFLYLFCVMLPWPVSIVMGTFSSYIGTTAFFAASSAVPYAAMLAVSVAFIIGYRQRGASGLSGTKITAFLLAAAVECAIYPMMLFISDLCVYLAPDKSPGISGESIVALRDIGFFGGYVLLAVTPAVVEELICRGIIYGSVRRYGAVPAIIVSTACFALLHLNIEQAAYTLLLGLAAGFVREYSGSVFPCVLMHLAFNTAGTWLIYHPAEEAVAMEGAGFMTEHGLLLAVGIFGLCAAAGLMVVLRKATGYRRDEAAVNSGGGMFPFLPYALGLATCIGVMVIR